MSLHGPLLGLCYPMSGSPTGDVIILRMVLLFLCCCFAIKGVIVHMPAACMCCGAWWLDALQVSGVGHPRTVNARPVTGMLQMRQRRIYFRCSRTCCEQVASYL